MGSLVLAHRLQDAGTTLAQGVTRFPFIALPGSQDAGTMRLGAGRLSEPGIIVQKPPPSLAPWKRKSFLFLVSLARVDERGAFDAGRYAWESLGLLSISCHLRVPRVAALLNSPSRSYS